MPKDARDRVRTGRDLFEVGAADTAGVHADQDLARPDCRNRNGLKADIILTAVDGGEHRGWDLVLGAVRDELVSQCHGFSSNLPAHLFVFEQS